MPSSTTSSSPRCPPSRSRFTTPACPGSLARPLAFFARPSAVSGAVAWSVQSRQTCSKKPPGAPGCSLPRRRDSAIMHRVVPPASQGTLMADAFLEVLDLHKRYGPTVALDGVRFRVHEGEMFGLLGPN